jgi:hypothetical protein
MQIQDLLSIVELQSIPSAKQLTELFCHHHCYYEGIVHLRSGVLSLLNLNSTSSITMLRPVVEQFSYAIYWDLLQDSEGSARYNRWLSSGKGKPSFREAMTSVETVLSEKRPIIQERVQSAIAIIRQAYHTLCAWTHTPILDESFITGGLSSSQGGFGDWLYCVHMYNITLHSILRLFLYQYPMALFPIDIIRKWGCNMPVGVYVDKCAGAIVEEAVGEVFTRKLRRLLLDDTEVAAKLRHAAEFRDLTDEEIWQTWEKLPSKTEGLQRPDTIDLLSAQQKAQIRSMGWAFNYLPKSGIKEELSSQEEQFFKKLYGESHQAQEL